MKLLRIGPSGKEKPVVIPMGSAETYDASSFFADFNREFFENNGVKDLASAVVGGRLPRIDVSDKRIGAPLPNPRKSFVSV